MRWLAAISRTLRVGLSVVTLARLLVTSTALVVPVHVLQRRDSRRECDNRRGSAGQGRPHEGVQVVDPALTVIEPPHRHALLAPADDHRSPPLKIEGPEGNASRG